MPRPPGSYDPYKWTLDLPPGSQCSVGWSRNESVDSEGRSSPGRPNEDRYYTCTYQDKIHLYMVLDGHDGTRACEFVQKHLPHLLLRADLERGDMFQELTKAFRSTEREFFIGIDPHITRRLTLVIEIQQKAENSRQASMLCPQQVDEIDHLDTQIKGGTTVVLALVYNDRLYVANVGDSRALLCTFNPNYGDQLRVEQLSKDHNTANDEELRRLAGCGLDPTELRKARRLGYQQNTRSIGDYSIKGGYQDVESISKARREPGTAEPYISQSINLNEICGFLILMSDGLYEAYEAWTQRPLMVNEDIAHLVAQEMKKTSDLSVVAQNVVENVKSLFCHACKDGQRSGRLDDITLIVRNFGYPMAIPHMHSYPGSMHSMPDMSSTSTGPPSMQDHMQSGGRVLHSVVSYPSYMHSGVHQSQPYGVASGGRPPYPVPASGGPLPRPDSRDYTVSQPHLSLASGSVSGNVATVDPVFYSMGPVTTTTRANYSGLQGADAQNRHQQGTTFGHNQGYGRDGFYHQAGVGVAGGEYSSNYPPQPDQRQLQHIRDQHTRGHQAAKHTMSDPNSQTPRHPTFSQRLTSVQEQSPRVPTNPDHGSVQQTKHEYENIKLRHQHESLQPGGGVGGGGDVQTNRYSDSLLAEKTRDMSLNKQPLEGVAPSATALVRPHSAEPPHQTANKNFSMISALPSMQRESFDQDDENFMLYGWKAEVGDSGDSSSMSTLTSSGIPSMQEGDGVSHTPSLPDTEAKTPVNGEVDQLGSSKLPHQSAGSSKEEERGEDEEWFTADVSDFSEASEPEVDDEIDAESGEIRSYIKNWGKFPLDLSWEEV